MQMNEDYQKAIDGTLVSVPSGGNESLTFHNMTSLTLVLYFVGGSGEHVVAAPLQGTNIPGKEGGVATVVSEQGVYWLAASADTGGFVTVYEDPGVGDADVYVTDWDLLEPNDIGTVPVPDPEAGILVPADSPRVVVGCGLVETDHPLAPNVVIREQFWQRMPNSYSVAPGETKEYAYTITSGKQETSSQLSTLEASVSASAGVGWGPVSATVSASLSTTSTTFQQLTVTEETTSYVSEQYSLDPKAEAPETMLCWQLTDVVSIWPWSGSAPLSVLATGTSPMVVSGPYTQPDPAELRG
ncbi:hypothetical protein [Kitasatospora cineracea]|uniref:hypothetical protein n=1 Tax=Kitasatospora cineracea TaxID=88074 RepID=UPI003F4CF37D